MGRSSTASSRLCGVRARCCPRVGPVVVGCAGFGHGEGIFVVAERGDAVEYADEVAEHRAHVHLGARRRGGELVGPDAGDHGPAGGDGTVEDWPGVDEVVRGCAGRCGHAAIVLTQTGRLMTGLMWKCRRVRADRLVAILLLLQRREQVTAAEVALELEVSERTARRDLDALAMAGVPVYSMQGRGGGWRLLGGARTDLSGLTASEARALFLVAGPASTATPAVKAALRKLVRALPEPFRAQAEAAATSVVVDPRHWGSSQVEHRPPRFLD